MEKNNNIMYRELHLDDLNAALLKTFNRYQETKRVWFKDNEQYKLKADYFTEQWDDEKKELVIHSLRHCVKTGGSVVGAFIRTNLVGFANVEGELFGSNKEYLELPYIHVSNECRNRGIGKKLFELCCIKAKQMGAKKLYIATHPSEETQYFYQAAGCIVAVEINQRIYDKEPLDIQLERVL
ncbi:GNAT family N-acetyltransferase [Bacillus sp. 165]|uniref:GNAT family N-acetyltransferase n=1 Tax=Bacillus sp. 165 TaxID=1529117 RepID=UPI001ADB8E58|nr:GNAT family N-acetyltransferase [Bacillus sp. 165]MBO9131480.1 GNAT family N-acetyltransferase [Bacillus sp. 165]